MRCPECGADVRADGSRTAFCGECGALLRVAELSPMVVDLATVTCQDCGSEVTAPSGTAHVFCGHCGAPVALPTADEDELPAPSEPTGPVAAGPREVPAPVARDGGDGAVPAARDEEVDAGASARRLPTRREVLVGAGGLVVGYLLGTRRDSSDSSP